MTMPQVAPLGAEDAVLSVRNLTTSFHVDGGWKPVVLSLIHISEPTRPY